MKKLTLHTAGPEELYRRGAERMAAQCPGWSDAYPSDPAVAILELGAAVSHREGRFFDAVRAEHAAAYLKLLGRTPQTSAPAALLARPLDRAGLYPGQRFWVDGVPFEVADTGKELGDIEAVSLRTGEGWRRWQGPGALAVRGDALELTFSKPLPPGGKARVWCGLRPEPGRAPPDGDTCPPVRLRALARQGETWRELPVGDGTCGLLKSGDWTLEPREPCAAVRLELLGELEGRPEIETVALEPALLIQRQTRSVTLELPPPFLLPKGLEGACILRFFVPRGADGWREAPGLFPRAGEVAGWSGAMPRRVRLVALEPDFLGEFFLREIAQERILLDETGVLPQSLALMVEEDGVWYDCPVGEPDAARTRRGCRWDAERGELCFGDGRDFSVPKSGRLMVSSCVCSAGAAANGAGGLLRRGETTLSTLAPAAGGRDRETPWEAFLRAAGEQTEPLRAVSLADFETAALRTPGLALAAARCIPRRGGAGVTVQVKPREGPLTPWRRRCVQNWLERFRPLGVPVSVEEMR